MPCAAVSSSTWTPSLYGNADLPLRTPFPDELSQNFATGWSLEIASAAILIRSGTPITHGHNKMSSEGLACGNTWLFVLHSAADPVSFEHFILPNGPGNKIREFVFARQLGISLGLTVGADFKLLTDSNGLIRFSCISLVHGVEHMPFESWLHVSQLYSLYFSTTYPTA